MSYRDEIIEVLMDKHPPFLGDGAFEGAKIIAEYIETKEAQILWSGDDRIYSFELFQIEELQISIVDLIELSKLGWYIHDPTLCVDV